MIFSPRFTLANDEIGSLGPRPLSGNTERVNSLKVEKNVATQEQAGAIEQMARAISDRQQITHDTGANAEAEASAPET